MRADLLVEMAALERAVLGLERACIQLINPNREEKHMAQNNGQYPAWQKGLRAVREAKLDELRKQDDEARWFEGCQVRDLLEALNIPREAIRREDNGVFIGEYEFELDQDVDSCGIFVTRSGKLPNNEVAIAGFAGLKLVAIDTTQLEWGIPIKMAQIRLVEAIDEVDADYASRMKYYRPLRRLARWLKRKLR